MKLNFTSRVIGGTLGGFALGTLLVTAWLGHRLEALLIKQVDRDLETAVLDGSDLLAKLKNGTLTPSAQASLSRMAWSRGASLGFIQIYDTTGKLAGQSDLTDWPDIAAEGNRLLVNELGGAGHHHFTTRTTEEHTHGIRIAYLVQPGFGIVRAGWDLTETMALLDNVKTWFAMAWLALVAIGSLLGWLAARAPVRGIQRVIDAATAFGIDGNAYQTVPANTGSAETDRLAAAFNHMAGRIETLLTSMRHMTDNIAHDIRTPVARMRTKAEHFLHQNIVPEVQAQILEDCDHILHLSGTLLEISQAEAGIPTHRVQSVNLADVTREAAELFEPVFEMNRQTFHLASIEDVQVKGEPHMIQRVLSNLLDNAAKYCSPGDQITLGLRCNDTDAVITIADTGPGIAEERQPFLFDRFYRGDASRSQPGHGLGLAFCKAAVEASGGFLTVDSSAGKGTTFRVSLPVVSNFERTQQ